MTPTNPKNQILPIKNEVLCNYFFTELTILSDGNVTTCCVDNEARNVFGNIYDHSLKEILEKHQQFKNDFIFNPKKCSACQTCLLYANTRYYMHNAESQKEIDLFVSRKFLPTQIVLETSSRCNVKCKDCIQNRLHNDLSSVRTGKGGADLDLTYTAEWLRPLDDNLLGIRAYNYGEPFLNKEIENFSRKMIARLPELQIGISTNGTVFISKKRSHSIIESGIYHIVISTHGGSASTSKKYMGTSYPFDRVIEGVSNFMDVKRQFGTKTPIVDLKCVLFEWNDSDEELASFENLALQLGVDLYHFMPTGGASGTKRFPPGSKAWNDFLKSGRAVGGDPAYISRIHPYATIQKKKH